MNESLVFVLIFVTISVVNGQQFRKDKFGNGEIIGKGGEVLEYQFLDDNGMLRQGNRIATKIFKYDSLGFLVSESYYKGSGDPYQYADGMAMVKYYWNKDRTLLTVVNFDSTGRHTLNKKIGASIICYRYNISKVVNEVTYFDEDSLQTNNADKYSQLKIVNEPLRKESYYDKTGTLVLVLDDSIRYFKGLTVQLSSLPKWLKQATRRNLVDGVAYKKLAYSLSLHDQSIDGQVRLSVSLVEGDVVNVKVVSSDGVPSKLIDKVKNSLNGAHFITSTNAHLLTSTGDIFVYFYRVSKSAQR